MTITSVSAIPPGVFSLVGGALFMLFGLAIAPIMINFACLSGLTAGITSFAGISAMNNLVPFVYYAIVIIASLGLIGLGAAGLMGRGPLAI